MPLFCSRQAVIFIHWSKSCSAWYAIAIYGIDLAGFYPRQPRIEVYLKLEKACFRSGRIQFITIQNLIDSPAILHLYGTGRGKEKRTSFLNDCLNKDRKPRYLWQTSEGKELVFRSSAHLSRYFQVALSCFASIKMIKLAWIPDTGVICNNWISFDVSASLSL